MILCGSFTGCFSLFKYNFVIVLSYQTDSGAQLKKNRIAMIGLPDMLIDILAAAFVNEKGLDINRFEGRLDGAEPEIYDDCNLIITSMDTEKLVSYACHRILKANPEVQILNLSENGNNGDLIGLKLFHKPLGEMFPEKILQLVRAGITPCEHFPQ